MGLRDMQLRPEQFIKKLRIEATRKAELVRRCVEQRLSIWSESDADDFDRIEEFLTQLENEFIAKAEGN